MIVISSILSGLLIGTFIFIPFALNERTRKKRIRSKKQYFDSFSKFSPFICFLGLIILCALFTAIALFFTLSSLEDETAKRVATLSLWMIIAFSVERIGTSGYLMDKGKLSGQFYVNSIKILIALLIPWILILQFSGIFGDNNEILENIFAAAFVLFSNFAYNSLVGYFSNFDSKKGANLAYSSDLVVPENEASKIYSEKLKSFGIHSSNNLLQTNDFLSIHWIISEGFEGQILDTIEYLDQILLKNWVGKYYSQMASAHVATATDFLQIIGDIGKVSPKSNDPLKIENYAEEDLKKLHRKFISKNESGSETEEAMLARIETFVTSDKGQLKDEIIINLLKAHALYNNGTLGDQKRAAVESLIRQDDKYFNESKKKQRILDRINNIKSDLPGDLTDKDQGNQKKHVENGLPP